ncbi:hypothetical protein GOV14_02120 [Candidatus Pacearchaeota archaeon]|nr:hypothetical protein [Candidatus Pacearchaeota archaeon]
MQDFDLKKECEKENFNYDEMWDNDESKKIESETKKLSKGLPRKGIKGKYLKIKGKVTKGQVKYSYVNGLKKIKQDTE